MSEEGRYNYSPQSSMPPKKQQDMPKTWVMPPPILSVNTRSSRTPDRPSKSSKKSKKPSSNQRPAFPPSAAGGRRAPNWLQVQMALDAASKKELKQLLTNFPLETVSLQHENGMSALHFGMRGECLFPVFFLKVPPQACSGGLFEHVRLLLDYGARINAQDEDGWTPLHFACQSGSSDIVALLLSKGARPTISNSIEQTALHVAASNGRKEVVSVLLDSDNGQQLIGMLDGNGATPLLWAACAGESGVCGERGERKRESWGG